MLSLSRLLVMAAFVVSLWSIGVLQGQQTALAMNPWRDHSGKRPSAEAVRAALKRNATRTGPKDRSGIFQAINEDRESFRKAADTKALKLLPDRCEDWEVFGDSFAVTEDGSLLAVASLHKTVQGKRDAGIVQIFERSRTGNDSKVSGYSLTTVLPSPLPFDLNQFGTSIAVAAPSKGQENLSKTSQTDAEDVPNPSNAVVVVGVPSKESDYERKEKAGAVFVFERSSETSRWEDFELTQKISGERMRDIARQKAKRSESGRSTDYLLFGFSSTLSSDGLLLGVGAPGEEVLRRRLNDRHRVFFSAVFLFRRSRLGVSFELLQVFFDSDGDATGFALSFSSSTKYLAVASPLRWPKGELSEETGPGEVDIYSVKDQNAKRNDDDMKEIYSIFQTIARPHREKEEGEDEASDKEKEKKESSWAKERRRRELKWKVEEVYGRFGTSLSFSQDEQFFAIGMSSRHPSDPYTGWAHLYRKEERNKEEEEEKEKGKEISDHSLTGPRFVSVLSKPLSTPLPSLPLPPLPFTVRALDHFGAAVKVVSPLPFASAKKGEALLIVSAPLDRLENLRHGRVYFFRVTFSANNMSKNEQESRQNDEKLKDSDDQSQQKSSFLPVEKAATVLIRSTVPLSPFPEEVYYGRRLAVAAEGDALFAGAPFDEEAGEGCGALYIHSLTGLLGSGEGISSEDD